MTVRQARALALLASQVLMLTALSIVVSGARLGDKNQQQQVRYQLGDDVPLTVEALTSLQAQLRRDPYEGLPVCIPGSAAGDNYVYHSTEQIDEGYTTTASSWVRGLSTFLQLQFRSPYQLQMGRDVFCQEVCRVNVSKSQRKLFGEYTGQYHQNFLVDDLPVAALHVDSHSMRKRYSMGIHLGFLDGLDDLLYVYNHVNFHIDYCLNRDDTYSIVGAAAEPLSLVHRQKDRNPSACPVQENQHLSRDDIVQSQRMNSGESILFTYDVIWREAYIPWKDRWDVYLTEDHLVPTLVHWYSIYNSVAVAIVFAAFIAVLLRNVRTDLNYDSDADRNTETTVPLLHLGKTDVDRIQELEEKGWKVVQIAVFQPPTRFPVLLAACCGAGAQLLLVVVGTVVLLLVGAVNPTRVDASIVCAIFLFGPSGLINGVVTCQVCKIFAVEEWERAARWSACLFPTVTMTAFLTVTGLARELSPSIYENIFQSSAMLMTFAFLVSAATTCIGVILGQRSEPKSIPDRPDTFLLAKLFSKNRFSRMKWSSKCCLVLIALFLTPMTIPLLLLWCIKRYLVKRKCWYPSFGRIYVLIMGGILSLGVIYVELFFLMTAAWMGQYYSEFGFLFIVTCIEIITTAQLGVLFGYYQLTVDGCFSWWWQFLSSGAVSLCVLVYSFFWFRQLEASSVFTPLVYFLTMTCASLALFLVTGFLGVAASLWFIRKAVNVAVLDESTHATKPLVDEETRQTTAGENVPQLGMELIASTSPRLGR